MYIHLQVHVYTGQLEELALNPNPPVVSAKYVTVCHLQLLIFTKNSEGDCR